MPVYPFFCPDHGTFEEYLLMGQGLSSRCPSCGKECKRDWKHSAVSHTVDFTPGWQPAWGKWVDTKRERDNLVARDGLVRG